MDLFVQTNSNIKCTTFPRKTGTAPLFVYTVATKTPESVQTNSEYVSTNSEYVSTNSEYVSTNSEYVSTNSEYVSTRNRLFVYTKTIC